MDNKMDEMNKTEKTIYKLKIELGLYKCFKLLNELGIKLYASTLDMSLYVIHMTCNSINGIRIQCIDSRGHNTDLIFSFSIEEANEIGIPYTEYINENIDYETLNISLHSLLINDGEVIIRVIKK